MDYKELLTEAIRLIAEASVDETVNTHDLSMAKLVELRELLNEQPELLTGGATRRCRVCGCTENNQCPDGCCWIESDLCSRC